MADKKISELAAKTTLVAADLMVIVDTEAAPDETKQITIANVAAYLASLTEELDNKTLDSSVLKGTFTTSGAVILDVGSGTLALNTTGALGGLNITSTSATHGACLTLSSLSVSPADNDIVARIDVLANSDTGVLREYAYIDVFALDVSNAAEIAYYRFNAINAGTINLAMYLTSAGSLWIDENLLLDTGQYVGMDATSKIVFANNSLTFYGILAHEAGHYWDAFYAYSNDADVALKVLAGTSASSSAALEVEHTGGNRAGTYINHSGVGTGDVLILNQSNTSSGDILEARYNSAQVMCIDSTGNIVFATGKYVGFDATSKITFAANAMTVDVGSGELTINTTKSGGGLILADTSSTSGGCITFSSLSASPAASDGLGYILWNGNNSAAEVISYGQFYCALSDPVDGQEHSAYVWYLYNVGASNQAMNLTGAGVLGVDLGGSGSAAQVDLFDAYDDALVLKETIQQNNREKLVEMGICDRKDTGSGYMLKIQPMIRLLAGGIYQSREMIDQILVELRETKDRLMIAERKLSAIEGVN
jgi:hypothetical protein